MRPERWLVTLLAVSLGLSIAAPAGAYCRTTSAPRNPTFEHCGEFGIPLYWPKQCVGYRIHQSGLARAQMEPLTALVARAFARWTNPGEVCLPSINVVPLAPTANGDVGWRENGPNSNLIVFRSELWPYAEEELELTTITWDVETGAILDADMEVNAADHQYTVGEISPDGYDIEVVLTHGAGHFLGLAHSEQLDSMMVREYVPGDPPQMSTDDAEGICAIYPESGERVTRNAAGAEIRVPAEDCSFTESEPEGECGPLDIGHGCSTARAPNATSWALVLGVLVAPWVVRRTRRARRRS
jgi:MYXO-CTERM domain-containing protein